MGGFLEEAKASAAREYGARHYRRFALLAALPKLAPFVAGVAVLAGVAVGGLWLANRWDTVASAADRAGTSAAGWLVPALVVAGTLAVLAGAGWAALAVWRRERWRWQRFI